MQDMKVVLKWCHNSENLHIYKPANLPPLHPPCGHLIWKGSKQEETVKERPSKAFFKIPKLDGPKWCLKQEEPLRCSVQDNSTALTRGPPPPNVLGRGEGGEGARWSLLWLPVLGPPPGVLPEPAWLFSALVEDSAGSETWSGNNLVQMVLMQTEITGRSIQQGTLLVWGNPFTFLWGLSVQGCPYPRRVPWVT